MNQENKLVLDKSVDGSFSTFHHKFPDSSGQCEVWICLSSGSFGVEQDNGRADDGDESIVMIDVENLRKFRDLVNHAITIYEGNV